MTALPLPRAESHRASFVADALARPAKAPPLGAAPCDADMIDPRYIPSSLHMPSGPNDVDEWLAEARWRDEYPGRSRLIDLPFRYWLGLAAVALWPMWAWLAAWIIAQGH